MDHLMNNNTDSPMYVPGSPTYLPGSPSYTATPLSSKDKDEDPSRGSGSRSTRVDTIGMYQQWNRHMKIDDDDGGGHESSRSRPKHGRNRDRNRDRDRDRDRKPYRRDGRTDERNHIVNLIRKVGSMAEYSIRRELPNIDVVRVLHQCDELQFHMEDGDRIWEYCDPRELDHDILEAIREGASTLSEIQVVVKRRFRIVRNALYQSGKRGLLKQVRGEGPDMCWREIK
jgi:hypothetical protein